MNTNHILGNTAKTKAVTRIWQVKDLPSVQQMFRQKLLGPRLFPTSLNLWSFYFPSSIKALVFCTQRDWQLHPLVLMTTILPLNLTSDSWVSSKKLVRNTWGQVPWKRQVTVEAIPRSLNGKEVSPRGQKGAPPVTHCSNLCWRDMYFMAPLKCKQIWIDKPRSLPERKVPERQRARWQTVPWVQGPGRRFHLNQPCDCQQLASLPRLQAPLSHTRAGPPQTPLSKQPMLWNRNACKLIWNYAVPQHTLQYIHFLNSKKKKKKNLIFIPDSPNSPKPKFTFLLTANCSKFYSNFVGVKWITFHSVKNVFWGDKVNFKGEKKIVKLYLWLFPRRTCRLYLLSGDEL